MFWKNKHLNNEFKLKILNELIIGINFKLYINYSIDNRIILLQNISITDKHNEPRL